jgi:hypothetical protein
MSQRGLSGRYMKEAMQEIVTGIAVMKVRTRQPYVDSDAQATPATNNDPMLQKYSILIKNFPLQIMNT